MTSGYTPKSSRRSGGERRADLRPSWMWLAVPLLIIGAVIGIWWGIGSSSTPSQPPTATPSPTAIARPQASATVTVVILVRTATAAPLPTATPTVMAGISPGAKVKVVNTEGAGLNMRETASTNGELVKTVTDGSVLTVLAGPKEADGYTWWQVSDDAGTNGWAADKWLELQVP